MIALVNWGLRLSPFQAPLIGIDIGAMWTKFSMVFCWLAASTVNWDTREDSKKAKK